MKKYLPVILVVVGLGVGFAGGYYFKTYQQSRLRSNFANGAATGQRFTPNRDTNRGGSFGGGIEGEIISMDDKSITVKLTDGSTKIVLFSDSTSYSNSLEASKSDLKTGVKIAVFGSSNTDGSVTAQRIQLNPITSMTPQK